MRFYITSQCPHCRWLINPSTIPHKTNHLTVGGLHWLASSASEILQSPSLSLLTYVGISSMIIGCLIALAWCLTWINLLWVIITLSTSMFAMVDWFASCTTGSSSVAGCWSWSCAKAVKKGSDPFLHSDCSISWLFGLLVLRLSRVGDVVGLDMFGLKWMGIVVGLKGCLVLDKWKCSKLFG